MLRLPLRLPLSLRPFRLPLLRPPLRGMLAPALLAALALPPAPGLAQVTPGTPVAGSGAPAASAASASAAASAATAASAAELEPVRFSQLEAAEPDAAASAALAASATPKLRIIDDRWFDQPLGPDPASWRFSAALERLGAQGQADALRRVLLTRHLAQLAGDTPDPRLTVRRALQDGAALERPENDANLRARWVELLNRSVQHQPLTAAVPVPTELEADSARLRELAPGLWTLHAPDGNLRGRVWWVQIRNQAAQPLALAEFRARAAGMPFDCSLPRYAEAALALPGRDTAYLCRANAGAGSPVAFNDLAQRLKAGQVVPLTVESIDLSGATPVQRVYARLEAPQAAAAQALASGTAGAGDAASAAASTAATAASASARGAAGVGRLRLLLLAGVALLVFAGLSKLGGRRTAVLGSWGLFTALALAMVFGQLPASWQLLPPLDEQHGLTTMSGLLRLLSAFVVPLFAAGALALLYELLGLLGRTVGGGLAGGVVDRVFDDRRR